MTAVYCLADNFIVILAIIKMYRLHRTETHFSICRLNVGWGFSTCYRAVLSPHSLWLLSGCRWGHSIDPAQTLDSEFTPPNEGPISDSRSRFVDEYEGFFIKIQLHNYIHVSAHNVGMIIVYKCGRKHKCTLFSLTLLIRWAGWTKKTREMDSFWDYPTP